VALFAALSYAITQTGRGSGSTEREKTAINAARFSSYMALASAQYTRYLVTNGSARLAAGSPVAACTTPTGSDNCFWYYNPQVPMSITVDGIAYAIKAYDEGMSRGVVGVGAGAGDYIIWFEGVPDAICTAINKSLGITGIPANTTAFPASEISGTPGQITACTKNPDGTTIYHYVVRPA
jgi:hypothetical protein